MKLYWLLPQNASGSRGQPKPPEYEKHESRLTKMKEEIIYSTPNEIQTPIQFPNPAQYRDNTMGPIPGTKLVKKSLECFTTDL